MPIGYKKDGTKCIPPSRKGSKWTIEQREKMQNKVAWNNGNTAKDDSRIVIGKFSGLWKGDNVKSPALHQWVVREKGKAFGCKICGTTEKRMYNWSNVDHKYSRNLDDYVSLCVPCHRKYDIEVLKINTSYITKKGFKMTDEHRHKLSVARMGKKPWNLGKPWSEEMKRKLSE